MQKNVTQTPNGVTIHFQGSVEKQQIIQMVQNCSSGQCACMNEDTKTKIKEMQVSGEDGDVTLALAGEISTEEIQEALNRSEIIKGD